MAIFETATTWRNSLVPAEFRAERITQPKDDDVVSRFARAIAAEHKLDRKNGRHGRASTLPHYLFLGESGDGKTTAIQAAGTFSSLIPVVTSGESTQNCDWWISPHAVFLDTTGRYATPSDAEQDHGEWYTLLRLLQTYRRRAPLQGIVVVMPVDHLVSSSETSLCAFAQGLRRRLDEAVRTLGSDVPVYIIISKCDLVEGFRTFVSQLPGSRATEALGYLADPPASASTQRGQTSAQQLTSGMSAITDQLQSLRLSMLAQDTPTEIHASLFCFVEEFTALQQSVATFLAALTIEDARYQQPFLRGLFFTSAAQQGAELSLLRRQFGLPENRTTADESPQDEQRTAWFLHDLFTVILPRDRHLASPTNAARRRRRLWQTLGLSAVAFFGFFLPMLYTWVFPPPGRLVVRVHDSGATVIVGNQTYGPLTSDEPLVIHDLSPGSYELLVKLDKHTEERRTETVMSREDTVVDVDLTPLTGSAQVRVPVDGATVTVDGKGLGQAGPEAPQLVANLIPGQHEVQVTKPGYRSAKRTITVKPGEETVVEFNLVPSFGKAMIQVSEDGVGIIVDGKQRGAAGRNTPRPVENLTPGKHRVVVVKAGYERIERQIVITAGEETVVEFELKLKPAPVSVPQPPRPRVTSSPPPLQVCTRDVRKMKVKPGVYEIVAATEVYLRPREGSETVETLEEGVRVVVVGICGDFVEVQPQRRPSEHVYVRLADIRRVPALQEG